MTKKTMTEPAGELEIDESDSEIEEEHNSPPRKPQFIAKSKWSKRGTFNKPISSGELNLSQPLIDEFDSLAFSIWNKIFSHDSIVMLVEQTNLYANRDKNE